MTTQASQTTQTTPDPAAVAAAAEAAKASTGTQPGAVDPKAVASTAASAATKPEGLDDAYWDATAGTVKFQDLSKDVGALKAFKAEADVRAQGVGKKPEDYVFDLGDLKGLDGQPAKLNADDPLLKGFRENAVKHGLTKEAANEMVRAYAATQLATAKAEREQFTALAAAETAKLGDNAKARVDAVGTALKGRIGDKAQPFINLMSMSAAAVEGLEALLRTTTAPSYQPGGGGTSEPDYKSMSPEERIEYARQATAAKKKAAA